MTRNDWLHAWFDALGVPHTKRNARACVAWIQAEGSVARWNPLNCVMKVPGSVPLIGNTAGVQHYPDFDVGVLATKRTIEQTNPELGFTRLLGKLKESAPPYRTLWALLRSQWGTGALAIACLPMVRLDYWRWADRPIAS